MNTPVTLKELARMLNLAPSTVSRALKGHPDISKTTQEKVRTLAERVNYRPSAMALGLRNRKYFLIAVIVPDLKDYFYAVALSGIIEFAYEHEYKVIVFESQEQYECEVAICQELQKSGIDGLLVAPAKTTVDIQHFRALMKGDISVVFFGRMMGSLDIDRVMEDDYYGACLAVNHLIEAGCQRIAHLASSQQWLWAQKRQMGYVQALLDHHMPVDRRLIIEYKDLEKIDVVVERLVNQYQVDGIFAVDDESAAKALLAIRQLGYKVPQDIAMCGFGNTPLSRVACPPLTTVDQDGREIGKVAVELLIQRVEGNTIGDSETKLLKNVLVVRESTVSVV